MDLTLLSGAFLAGFLSFISPCVLPLLPTFSLILAQNSARDGQEARRLYANTTAFLAGFTLVFVLLGATASLIGAWLFSYQELLRQGAAVLIIAMGIFMTGWIKIPLLLREYRPFQRRGFDGIGGAFLLGCGFTLGWTPCTGPMLATILLYAGDTATASAGALLLLVYSLGFAVPFFLLAVIWRRHIMKLRAFYQYLPRIQQTAGIVLVLLGILLWSDGLTSLVRFLS
ncbi:cytochrome c biogenesis CcdA family protein [uncultured Selenomonas sp.]|uniref:cytochrome c biogenesis CcdA family protein n=1 Tax=uncultured Selenomonas sp. TaxID=159275 RepID=UPI0028D47DE2|nr:cytochrome c biogenesis CcdA family protein [uncultured Selenomonas sp.]